MSSREFLRRHLLAAALVSILVFAATYALTATMNISGVGFLGGGEASVDTPNVTSVRWVIERQGNRWVVTGVQLTFDRTLPSGTTIYIDLLNSADATIASGSQTLSNDLPSGQPVTIYTSPSVRANEIAKIAISVEGPRQ